MDTTFPTTRKLKKMLVNIPSIVVIVAIALSGIWVPAKAAFAGDNGKIAFMTNRDSNFEIYVMDSDGANQTNLTNNPAYDGHPSWSPDGSQIAFASERDGNYEIYVMNADGSDPIRLTTSASTDAFPSWSPDGSQIAFTSYDFSLYNYDIWRMNSDGTGAVKLTDNPTEDTEPVWSPEGTKIAFRSDRDGNMEIYVMNPDGSDQTNLTNHADADGEPNWSPDGSKIAFASARDGFTGAIWVMNADGSEPTRLTDAVYGDGDPAWSPDGTRIVFKGFRHYNDEIYVMNADGTDITRLTNNAPPGNTFPEDWMPDWQPISFAANPYVVASEAGNWFWTTGFKPGTLSLSIYQSADEGATLLWDGTGQADETGFVLVGYESHGQDLVPGNYLVVSDGDTQKGLVLELITMEVFDTDTEIMAGTAPPGRDVWAMAGPQDWQQPMMVKADPDTGAWLADFKTLAEPFDITEEMRPWSYAHIYDEDGDANEAGAPPPPPPPLNPHFTVFPEWEWFDGWDWPDGATVTITVGGKPECATAKESWGNFFNGSFGEGCDVAVGDVVTFTDGTTTRTHTVRKLAITEVDKGANIVRGTADAGAEVYVWPHATGEQQLATMDTEGNWEVNFSGIYDLVPGADGRSQINDEVGNATAVDWRVPNPHIVIFPAGQWYEGLEWPDGSIVTITVQDKPACETSKESWGGYFSASFAEGCTIEFGDSVTFADGTTTRTHIVQHLIITGVDQEANTLAGTADTGATVYASVWGVANTQVTAEDGKWLIDFGSLGVDLVEGMSGRTAIRDEFGNETAVDWRIPKPRMVVFPEWEWFDGNDWPDGPVNITVAGKPECATTRDSLNYFFNGSFGEGCNVVVGDQVAFENGAISRTHTVLNLAITDVNDIEDIIAGTADAGATVHVWPHKTGQELQATVDPDGNWMVDFTGTFDLVPGEAGRSQINDEVGNATAVDWFVPWAAQTYTVNTTDDIDDGSCDETHCSLKEAINVANERAAADTIAFNIPGEGPFTIRPEPGYNHIEDTVTIDGTTQPGYAGTPLIELDGTYAGFDANGLVLAASDSIIKGLAINRFGGNGVIVFGDRNTIQGNYIGTDVTGTTTTGTPGPALGDYTFTAMPGTCPTYPAETDFDGFISESDDPLAPWSGTAVHFMGTDADKCGSPETFEGASLIYRYKLEFAEESELASIAVSGAAFNGSILRVLDADMNILGTVYNYAGNSFSISYVALDDIAGRVFYVEEYDWSSTWRFRQSIVINGPLPLGNYGSGVFLGSGVSDNHITGNVISGNRSDGIYITEGASQNLVQNNLVGTDVTGTVGLGNWSRGIVLNGGANNNLIAGNVVSANWAAGIRFHDSGTTENRVEGNFVGTDVTGANPLGNGYIGIRITDDAANNTISSNTIAFNADAGVAMNGEGVTGNALLSNSVFANGGFGIDLGEDGITPNDPRDLDTGSNKLQNYPILNSVTRLDASLTIRGVLPSTPGTTFRLEFFGNDSCDPSVSGEGQAFLGFATVKTNPAGIAHFEITLPISLPLGAFVTATATDPLGNTSEFSKCFSPAPGWNLVNYSGFGDPSTIGATALEVFQNQLYAGASNWNTGAEVWRLGQDGLWLQVNEAGFGGGSANPAIIDLTVFQDNLYAGTGWNNETPGQVWRSADGTNWQPVTTDGFGDGGNTAITNFVVFKGKLYAGTNSTSGSGQIWRSNTGNSGSWTQVAFNGSEFTGQITGFAVYKGMLFVTNGDQPLQVWRSANGNNWGTVTVDGFGDERNWAGGFAQFGGYLYLGTTNDETGAQLWRTMDGINWVQVMGDGFGDSNNRKIESLFVYDDLLYAVTFNEPMGLQVWRSADGTNWEQVAANGFGDSGNFATLWINATTAYQGNLFVGTWNYNEGGEVWRFTP